MSAVVRVKRRIDEEPLSAFIINCKKPKLDDDVAESLLASKDEVSTIVKFAATLESPDEEATLQIAKLTKDEAKELATKVHKYPSALDRTRQQMRDRVHENRFKVVNCYRAIENNQNDLNNSSKEITIVDVEKQPIEPVASSSNRDQSSTSNAAHHQQPLGAPKATTSGTNSNDKTCDPPNGYVYDLYLADEAAPQCIDNTNLMDDYFSVRPFDNLVYEDYNHDDDDYDSEDSNQEDYFGNEYPDTEDDDNESINCRDMRRAVYNMDFDGYELSSDEDDRGFVYSIDSEAIGFEDDVDYCDVNRYGETYARYKGRAKTNREAIYNDNESDCSDVYCKKSDDDE